MKDKKYFEIVFLDRNNDIQSKIYFCKDKSQAKRLFYYDSENGDMIIDIKPMTIKQFQNKHISFKLGNIVKLTNTYWYGQFQESKEDIGKLYVISEINGSKYSIMSKEDGNESSWWNSNQLEFVSEGSLDEIEACKKLYDETINKLKDLDYIKSLYDQEKKLDLSSASILALLNEIDFISAFEINGEYICLYNDWFILKPLFKAIFDNDYDKMIEYTEIFSDHCKEKFKLKAIELFNKVNKNV